MMLTHYGSVPARIGMNMPNDIVNYPPVATTDNLKLACVYRLIEEMRLEHNRQGAIARADWKNLKDKWYVYAGRPKHFGGNVFKKKLKPLLSEQANLRNKILEANYTAEQWKKLTDIEQLKAKELLFGDKQTLKEQPTLATSSLVNELKTIDIATLTGYLPPDPVQDLDTDFTEVDVGANRLTVNDTRCTVTNVDRDEEVYLYRDMGANHFDGDFEHLFTITRTAASGVYPVWTYWALSNGVDDAYMLREGATGILHVWGMWHASPALSKISLEESYSGSHNYDSFNISASTIYHLTVERDVDAGDYGELYCYTYEDDGGERGDLLDTMTVVLASDVDLRYIYAGSAWTGGYTNRAYSGYTENLDLQEAAVGWANIAKANGMTTTDLAKLNGIAVAGMAKICGVAV